MTAKHTPGPWAWAPGTALGAVGSLYGQGGVSVLDHASYENIWFATFDRVQDEANARLIAAAPDGLEIAQDALPILDVLIEAHEEAMGDQDEIARDLRDRLKAFIAKATGVSQ